MKEEGYVFILINPTFKENWVKIGYSNKSIDALLQEVNEADIPLPYELYATMHTAKYVEAENLVKNYIESFTDRQLHSNRSFFNVSPEEALEILYQVKDVLDDAVICEMANTVRQESSKGKTPKPERKATKKAKIQNLPELPKGRIKLLLNGKGPYQKYEFGYRVIEEFLIENPKTTFKELQQLFPHKLIGSWSGWPLLQPDLEFAQKTKDEGRMRYYAGKGGCILTTSDGVRFMVSSQWDWRNLPGLLQTIEKYGMTWSVAK